MFVVPSRIVAGNPGTREVGALHAATVGADGTAAAVETVAGEAIESLEGALCASK